MKNIFKTLMTGVLFLFAFGNARAQDSTQSSATQHIHETSEQAEKLYGKKIQQQTLTLQSFEKADTAIVQNQHKKKCARCKHKHR